MTLQSQAPRVNPIRTAPDRRAGGLSPNMMMLLAGVGVLAVAAAGYVAYRVTRGAAEPVAGNPADPLNQSTDAKTLAQGGTPMEQPKPKPKPPEPVSFEMGREASRPLVQAPGTQPGSQGPGSSPTSPASVSNPAPAPSPGPTTPSNPATENPNAPGIPPAAPQGDTPMPETREPLAPGAGSTLPNKDVTAASEARTLVEQANRAQGAGNLVEARTLLNRALLDTRVPASDRQAIRLQMASINESLIFSPSVAKGDSLCDTYTIASGDNLVTVRAKQSLPIDWRFLQRINKINPSALKIGQKLKLVRFPFHAVVHKNDFRMDLYIGDPLTGGRSLGSQVGPDGQDPSWIYVRSFTVGLGENNGTPEGLFTVKPKSKLVNPPWVNPRTGEKFGADDAKNPIGEFWVGLQGADDATKKFTGYGVHGTIDPDSIGKTKSMGCVRLANDDIALVYEVLTENLSTVKIMK